MIAVGYIAALLYNQNNVASMASGVTLQLEREVATELCRMAAVIQQPVRQQQGRRQRAITWGAWES